MRRTSVGTAGRSPQPSTVGRNAAGSLSPAMSAKVEAGNRLARWAIHMIRLCSQHGVPGAAGEPQAPLSLEASRAVEAAVAREAGPTG